MPDKPAPTKCEDCGRLGTACLCPAPPERDRTWDAGERILLEIEAWQAFEAPDTDRTTRDRLLRKVAALLRQPGEREVMCGRCLKVLGMAPLADGEGIHTCNPRNPQYEEDVTDV
jgi:hypothetical protein